MKEATLHFHPAQDTETVDNGTVLLQWWEPLKLEMDRLNLL
jgi:hypothetical protein